MGEIVRLFPLYSTRYLNLELVLLGVGGTPESAMLLLLIGGVVGTSVTTVGLMVGWRSNTGFLNAVVLLSSIVLVGN